MGMVISIGQAWPADESMRPAITASVEKAREAGAPTGPDASTLNFVNADIGSVVKVVSEITGKNFVLDPWVKGEINIVAAKPMPRSVVYDVFLSALRLQGFAVIKDHGI
jgi:general secretion pathway protein D